MIGVIFPTENMPKEDTKLYTTPPESGKKIEELTATIAELQNKNLKQYKYTSELQAHINVLREAVENLIKVKGRYNTEIAFKRLEETLATTPAQSLIQHDNEVIEKCAVAMENYHVIEGVPAMYIRALKGKE